MQWLAKLLGGGLAEPINAIGSIIDDVYTSEEERLSASELLLRIEQEPHKLQAEISKIEASHRSTFVAGWRPAIGWVCSIGLAFVFVINPIVQWSTGQPGPEMPLEAMTTLVVSLLGLGGLRTFEKVVGRAK